MVIKLDAEVTLQSKPSLLARPHQVPEVGQVGRLGPRKKAGDGALQQRTVEPALSWQQLHTHHHLPFAGQRGLHILLHAAQTARAEHLLLEGLHLGGGGGGAGGWGEGGDEQSVR